MIVIPASLPVQPIIEQSYDKVVAQSVSYGNSRLDLAKGVIHVRQSSGADHPEQGNLNEPPESTAEREPQPQTKPSPSSPPDTQKAERRTFWERVFNVPPMRKRLERVFAEEWKLNDIRTRNIDWLLTPEGEEARIFFLYSGNARQYHRLVKEFGCGFEDRSGRISDDTFDTLNEYGPDLIKNYSILMDNKESIKRYFAGNFRNGRIGTETLIRISNSMWFSPFVSARFRVTAKFLHDRFQVPNHVVGPMLASVGDSPWLRRVLFRKTAVQEFQQLLSKISPAASEESGNAFAPALQLMVLGEEHKLPYPTLVQFVTDLKLKPKDFGPFSAVVFNLGLFQLANEIKCPTFSVFLRKQLDEFGGDFNQESARYFLLSYRDFKDDAEALSALVSPQYAETKAYLKSIGTPVPSTVWNMERIAVLTHKLTPEKKEKIAQLVRQLPEELRVADIMFLADILDNEEEVKLLLNRPALLAAVKEVKIDRIVERSNNDLVKELEREIDIANRNGLHRTVRRLMNLVKEEKRTYSERVEPDKLSNVQLSRLLIFHRSLEMPGFLETLGWNVSKDLQNERSEGGGYLGYDKDMAMVTMVPGTPGDNRQYRPSNLTRAPASLALFHNHAFKDTFAERYLGF
ncbi:MAG TPA: hypothetical protein VFZ34_04965, partial [Blastocatellia bacterium]|nr:hypothetical protein [Blastocatellia bacterium]